MDLSDGVGLQGGLAMLVYFLLRWDYDLSEIELLD